MRQYYDFYCLLKSPEVQAFIGFPEHIAHKSKRSRGADNEAALNEHPVLLLPDDKIRESFQMKYFNSAALCYKHQLDFSVVLAGIAN